MYIFRYFAFISTNTTTTIDYDRPVAHLLLTGGHVAGEVGRDVSIIRERQEVGNIRGGWHINPVGIPLT